MTTQLNPTLEHAPGPSDHTEPSLDSHVSVSDSLVLLSGHPESLYGGRYQILALLGTGGSGTVYRARDTELGEVVALKLLHREALRAPAALERFRSEVRLSRRVTHRNVARMFDIGAGRLVSRL